MPAYGDNPTRLVMVCYGFTHNIKRHTVQILLISQFYVAQITPQNGRIITANLFNITAAFFILPGMSVKGKVFLSKEKLVVSYSLLQPGHNNICFRRNGPDVFFCTGKRCDCQYNQCQSFHGHKCRKNISLQS
ncbi:MAG: hypothetical protein BWX93_01876 [Bacteroidetes bacterium ADurb.Bin139]|nr:MAG: hypothetical protein BWX93_01876 [Bacteroidetes bacterium ADurb.Bin139]